MNVKIEFITAHEEDICLNTKMYHKIPFIVSIYYSFTIFITFTVVSECVHSCKRKMKLEERRLNMGH